MSITLGLILGESSDGILWYIVTAILIAAGVFVGLFVVSVIVMALFHIGIEEAPKPVPSAQIQANPKSHRRRRRRKRKKASETTPELTEDDYDYIYGTGLYNFKKPRSQMTFLERLRDNRGY